jgi:uncharacterized repeat protein (TIGR01451 family)
MTRVLTLALYAAVSLTACKPSAPPAPPAAPAAPAEPAAPAAAVAEAKQGAELSVASVDLGKDLGADNRITTALETFKPGDTIIAAIALNNTGTTPADGNVGVRWTGPDGQPFNDESQAKSWPVGAQYVVFRVANPKGFPLGSYKVEVSLNGSVVQMREFTVN